MKMSSVCLLIFIKLCEASAQLIFAQRTQTQSLLLSCSLERGPGSLTGLHLYHRRGHAQTTLLSISEHGDLRVDLEHQGRLQLCGGLDSLHVNVTLIHLQPSDAGLYMWEQSYRQNRSDRTRLTEQKLFLMVESSGTSFGFCTRYSSLLLVNFTTAGFLVLILSCLLVDKRVKTGNQDMPQAPVSVPVYEEMARKQQMTTTAQNNHSTPSHPEEAKFPVYANPNIRHQQENYYACPRPVTRIQ
ncbi:uncharacterized protein LOC117527458 [Thalassophryne amazonica]|uniref:uncharacterized protein LOC117527458 n=1 Tax=Thalassophryne amazonica TaxID=390379 RepID=UPI001471E12B|nr:uncharacterized protein LOC117527458 [Thalassophryne amazonica]